MSAFDKFLASLNPIGSAEAQPLMPGALSYPYAKAQSAALALGHGASDKDIWKRFGLYKSPMENGSNALVGEIPDTNASLNPGKARTISDVLDHPALFNSYPDLAKIPVSLTRYSEDKLPAQRGRTLLDTDKSIALNIRANYATDAQKKDTLLHEFTHAIQHEHGFPSGTDSNSQSYGTYIDSPGEEQARMTELRALMTPKNLAKESPKTTIERMRKYGSSQSSIIQELLK